jgi:hypothetical protein
MADLNHVLKLVAEWIREDNDTTSRTWDARFHKNSLPVNITWLLDDSAAICTMFKYRYVDERLEGIQDFLDDFDKVYEQNVWTLSAVSRVFLDLDEMRLHWQHVTLMRCFKIVINNFHLIYRVAPRFAITPENREHLDDIHWNLRFSMNNERRLQNYEDDRRRQVWLALDNVVMRAAAQRVM